MATAIRDSYAISAGLGALWVAPAVTLALSGENFVVPAASFATAYYLYDGTATGLFNAYVSAGSVFAVGFQVMIMPQLLSTVEGDVDKTWNQYKSTFLKALQCILKNCT